MALGFGKGKVSGGRKGQGKGPGKKAAPKRDAAGEPRRQGKDLSQKKAFGGGKITGGTKGYGKELPKKATSEKEVVSGRRTPQDADRSQRADRQGRDRLQKISPGRDGFTGDRSRQAREMPALERDDIIAGRNPVREALRSNRPINRLLILQGDLTGSLGEIQGMAKEKGIPVQRHPRERLDNIAGGIVHQGVVALAASREYADLDHILEGISADKPPFILVLDEINDPHNLGAILRTADAAGVDGVVIPSRRSASLTPVVARTSAGAVEYVPVARVTNIPATIEDLKKRGLWVAGAHMEGGVTYWEAGLEGPLALVIGGEGKGLGRLAREKCDIIVTLPMLGQVGSLNASVAAGLLMYEVLRQRSRQ